MVTVLDQLRIKYCIGIGDGAGSNIIVRFVGRFYYLFSKLSCRKLNRFQDKGPIKVNRKFSMSILGFSISVLNPNLETHALKPGFPNLGFSAIVDFILWFCTLASAVKPGVLNLFLSSKKRFSNPAFQNSCSNPN